MHIRPGGTNYGGYINLRAGGNSGDMRVYTGTSGTGTLALTINSSQNATFAGNIIANTGIYPDAQGGAVLGSTLLRFSNLFIQHSLQMRGTNTGHSNVCEIQMEDSAGVVKGILGWASASNSSFYIDNRYYAEILFRTNNTDRMRVTEDGHFMPNSDNTYQLGSSAQRWSNLYVADIQLSNEGTGGNEIDGTEGSWTIQEGEEDLFVINRKTGKKFKMNLTEI
jgi:hypothetical protein